MRGPFEVLTGCGGWSATPDNYSSLRSLQLAADRSGRVLYGYGQTIHALINLRFQVAEPDLLELEYLESPPYQRFSGFRPEDANRRKALRFKLVEGAFTFVEDITGQGRRFLWRLELDGSPYPEGMSFPFGVPTTFYGHCERLTEGESPK